MKEHIEFNMIGWGIRVSAVADMYNLTHIFEWSIFWESIICLMFYSKRKASGHFVYMFKEIYITK